MTKGRVRTRQIRTRKKIHVESENNDMELNATEMIRLSDDLKNGCTATIRNTQSRLIHYKESLKEFYDELEQLIWEQKDKNAMIGILGDMSCGKTSLIDALIGLPLFPIAAVTTSVCPVEFHYGSKPSFTVFTYEKKIKDAIVSYTETPVYTFDEKTQLTEVQKQELVRFASDCVRLRVLLCENLTYYYPLSAILDGSFAVDWNNPMQAFQLMAILLAGHVGQDVVRRLPGSDELVARRAELLKNIVGLDEDANYGIRIHMESGLLQNGLVLVDLPGLGSNAGKHDGITTEYLYRADSIILVYGDDANTKETNVALKSVLKSEKMQTEGKDSRFLAVINKCDKSYESDPDGYSFILSQAVQQIKPQCEDVNISEIIPISAFYADYRYVESGIDLKMTRIWTKNYKRKAEKKGLSPQLLEDAREELYDNYHTEFEYVDIETKKTVRYSTADFMEKTVGQYTARIRFLNALNNFDNLVKKYNDKLTELQMDEALLKLIETCGDQFMKSLLTKMEKAFQNVERKFVRALDAAQAEIASQQTKLTVSAKQASDAYLKGLDSADKEMNKHMGDVIDTMESDWAGHVCIDGADDKSKGNKNKFESLCSYMESFDFTPHLESGDKLLQEQMDIQRKTYSGNKKKFKACFADFKADMRSTLEQTYDTFASDAKSQSGSQGFQLSGNDLEIYKKCYQSALNAILKYLDTLTDQMCQEIDRDNRVNEEIGKTVKNIQDFFTDYRTKIHLGAKNYVQTSCKGYTFWNNRPYLDTARIRSELSRPFSSEDERKKYLNRLPAVLCDQNQSSHSSRMVNTSRKVFASFRNNASNKMTQFFPSIKTTVTNYFNHTAAELSGKHEELKYQGMVLLSSVEGLRDADGWKDAYDYGSSEVWAEKDVGACADHAEEFIADAKKFVNSINGDGQ